jgi:type 1 glutamine amidotransferase
MLRWSLASLLSLLLLAPAPASGQSGDDLSLMVYSHTNGYRHQAIPDGIAALRALGRTHGWTVEATEDSTAFRRDRLSQVDVVVFLNTSGDVLGPQGQDALRRFVENGGGYVGVHAAADTEYDWPWYGRLVGAYFEGHPEIQEATLRVEDAGHPATRPLDRTWVHRDEWYNYRSNPRDSVRVLLTLDESTYEGGTMGDDHPITWCRTLGDGRAWYTGLGHTPESYADADVRALLTGGVRWAAGAAE